MFLSSADNENHTKGDSPKASSASGPQEQLWRVSQPQALPSVKIQIQPQSITQRNHALSRKYCNNVEEIDSLSS